MKCPHFKNWLSTNGAFETDKSAPVYGVSSIFRGALIERFHMVACNEGQRCKQGNVCIYCTMCCSHQQMFLLDSGSLPYRNRLQKKKLVSVYQLLHKHMYQSTTYIYIHRQNCL